MITDARESGSGYVTIRYPAGRYGEVAGFYDGYATEGSGWHRSEAGQGDVPSVNYINLRQGWNISVAPPVGERMLVTLTASAL